MRCAHKGLGDEVQAASPRHASAHAYGSGLVPWQQVCSARARLWKRRGRQPSSCVEWIKVGLGHRHCAPEPEISIATGSGRCLHGHRGGLRCRNACARGLREGSRASQRRAGGAARLPRKKGRPAGCTRAALVLQPPAQIRTGDRALQPQPRKRISSSSRAAAKHGRLLRRGDRRRARRPSAVRGAAGCCRSVLALQREPHVGRRDGRRRSCLPDSTVLLLLLLHLLPFQPELRVELRDNLLLAPSLGLECFRLREELPVLQAGGGQDLGVRRAEKQRLLVELHAHVAHRLRPALRHILRGGRDQRRVQEGHLIAAPAGVARSVAALGDALAPLRGAVRMRVLGVAPALVLVVEVLLAHRPLRLLLLELAEARVAQLVVVRALGDAHLRRVLQPHAEAVRAVVPKGADRVQRLPRGGVVLLEPPLALERVAALLAAGQLPKLGGRGEDHDGMSDGHVVLHGLKLPDELLHALDLRIVVGVAARRFGAVHLPLELPLLDLGLDLAGHLQLLLERVDALAEEDHDPVAVAGRLAVLDGSLAARDLQAGAGPPTARAAGAEVELQVLRAALQDVALLLVRVALAMHDVVRAADQGRLLEAAGHELDLGLVVPLRVDRVLDHRRLHDGRVRGLTHPPAPLVEAPSALLAIEHLVLDIRVHVGVAGGRGLAPAPQDAGGVGAPDALCLDDLHLELAGVQLLLQRHAVLPGLAGLRQLLLGDLGEGPGRLDEEVALAVLLLFQVLARVRARSGAFVLLRRRRHHFEDELLRLRRELVEGRQPALAQEVVLAGGVVVPDLEQHALAHVYGIQEVLVLLLARRVGDGDLELQRRHGPDVADAVVRGRELAERLAEQRALQDARDELGLRDRHLHIAGAILVVHIHIQVCRREVALAIHLDLHVLAHAVAGADVADPEDLPLAGEGVLDLHVGEVVAAHGRAAILVHPVRGEERQFAVEEVHRHLVRDDDLVPHVHVAPAHGVALLLHARHAVVGVEALVVGNNVGINDPGHDAGAVEDLVRDERGLAVRHGMQAARQHVLHDVSAGLERDRVDAPARRLRRAHELLAHLEAVRRVLVAPLVAPDPLLGRGVPAVVAGAHALVQVAQRVPPHRRLPLHVVTKGAAVRDVGRDVADAAAHARARVPALDLLLVATLVVQHEGDVRVLPLRGLDELLLELE
mmetsp:Transcript_51079/g.131715  ORF Transcript_51079/g.131715 Transcript_51079/m.131715 type:complete len:1170 (-) Transcript_51079:2497-6006(-)